MNVASRAPPMKRDWLDWPFFGESHRAFAGALDRFVASGAIAAIDHEDVDGSCRHLARALGGAPSTGHRLASVSASVVECDLGLPGAGFGNATVTTPSKVFELCQSASLDIRTSLEGTLVCPWHRVE